ncbi:MAG: hypothetical protein E7323_03870 [Clostridiales bacterium]|nr:hypothetical protein [Clostridiales bacterium]
MMFWQWLGLAVAAAVLCLVVRRLAPEAAGVLAVIAGGILLMGALESVSGLQSLLDRLAALGGLNKEYLSLLMKVLGMSYATDLAAQTCEDLGEKGLALKVGMVGKWCMFGVIAPMLLDLLEMIVGLVP